MSRLSNKNLQLRLLSYIVIAYMILAFTWWSVLLFTKNGDAFQAKRDLLKIGMIAEGLIESDHQFHSTVAYQELAEKYKRQEYMIFGEATVFVITLLIGLWLINRGYNREMMAAKQRRNFLLSITHELKSPIASIRLVLETFLKRDLNREQKVKLGNNAIGEAERLNNLVNDLLLSARLETTFQPNVESLNLADLVAELNQKLIAKYPNAIFIFEKPTTFPSAPFDKLGMTSVILNLLENAIKYGSENPKITTTLSQNEDTIQLEIADNGIGISDKEKKRIFEKFYRVGNEDTRSTKGTGLGLFIADQIVKAHNGTIEVFDNKPNGTIFKIAFERRMVGS